MFLWQTVLRHSHGQLYRLTFLVVFAFLKFFFTETAAQTISSLGSSTVIKSFSVYSRTRFFSEKSEIQTLTVKGLIVSK